MRIRQRLRDAILATLFWTGACDVLAQAYATLAIDSGGDVSVAYHFPAGSHVFFPGLPEWQETVRKPSWKMDSACYELDGLGIRLKSAVPCEESSIKLTWDERPRDRMYPAVVKLRNGGILVYAAYLEVLTLDRTAVAEIRMKAPPGGVAAFRDLKSNSELILDSSTFAPDGGGWLYFGPDEFSGDDSVRVMIDGGIPDSLQRKIADLVPRLVALYAQRTGRPYPRRPTIYLTWNGRDKMGQDFQADVVPGGEIRFGMTGSSWSQPDEAAIKTFSITLAHEIAHFWNTEVYPHPDWAASWLAEGNSEIFSLGALVGLGIIDPAEAALRVSTATNECIIIAAGRAWSGIPDRQSGRTPYACGLAVQFAIVAALRRNHPDLDAFDFWRGVWSESANYYEASLQRHILALGDEELASILGELLVGQVPLEIRLSQLHRLARLHSKPLNVLSATLGSVMGAQIVAALMAEDCAGSYSVYRKGESFLIDYPDGISCKTLKSGTSILRISGASPTNAPLATARAVEETCSKGRYLSVSTGDGATMNLACPNGQSFAQTTAMVDLNGREVVPALNSTQARGVVYRAH